jgi:uncharacterized protein
VLLIKTIPDIDWKRLFSAISHRISRLPSPLQVQRRKAAKENAMSLLCPSCKVDLVMSDRSGIEIDYCPKCRGVWLDRGELDKIIERVDGGSRMSAPPQAQPGMLNQGLFGGAPQPPPQQYDRGRDQRRYDDDDDHHRNYKHGKRKNWLSEIFD